MVVAVVSETHAYLFVQCCTCVGLCGDVYKRQYVLRRKGEGGERDRVRIGASPR
jgi:hypothetical protein